MLLCVAGCMECDGTMSHLGFVLMATLLGPGKHSGELCPDGSGSAAPWTDLPVEVPAAKHSPISSCMLTCCMLRQARCVLSTKGAVGAGEGAQAQTRQLAAAAPGHLSAAGDAEATCSMCWGAVMRLQLVFQKARVRPLTEYINGAHVGKLTGAACDAGDHAQAA